MVVFHDQKREKSDAAGASRDADFGNFACWSGWLAAGCEK
jgi:hypothetical protein